MDIELLKAFGLLSIPVLIIGIILVILENKNIQRKLTKLTNKFLELMMLNTDEHEEE